MIDHVTLTVRNVLVSMRFYEKALAPLGLKPLADKPGEYCGFGDTRAFFWIAQAEANQPPSGPTHVAFTTDSREKVNAFHRAALAAGGRDNGAPDYCPEYSPNYYGGFVFDPDGNNLEAVFRDPSV